MEVVLPRARERRKRRPPKRKALYLGWMLVNLTGALLALVKGLEGRPFELGMAGFYAAVFVAWRGLLRAQERSGMIERPVARLEWGMLLTLAASLVPIALT